MSSSSDTDSPLKPHDPPSATDSPLKVAEISDSTGPVTRYKNNVKEGNSTSAPVAQSSEDEEREDEKENREQRKKKGGRRLSQPESEIAITPKRKRTTDMTSSTFQESLNNAVLEGQRKINDESMSILVLRQETKNMAKDVRKTYEQVKNIITLQNAKPQWIVSSQSILTSINCLVNHQSNNYQQINKLNENCRSVLEHLSNSDLFTGRHDQVMQKLEELKKQNEAATERLTAMENSLGFLEKEHPSAHLPYKSYPPNSIPLVGQTLKPRKEREQLYCVLCNAHSHNLEECQSVKPIGEKLKTAAMNKLCTRCLCKYEGEERDERGGHKECPKASIHCENCENAGLQSTDHNQVFCPIREPVHKRQPKEPRGTSSGRGRGAPVNHGQ